MQKIKGKKIGTGFAIAIPVLVILLVPVEPVSELEYRARIGESVEKSQGGSATPQVVKGADLSITRADYDESLSVEVREELALNYSMLQEGKFASFMDAIFSPSNVAAIREAFGGRLRFRTNSRAQTAEESANRFFESHYKALLLDLNLSSDNSARARSIIVDDIRRESELVTLWTDRKIDYDEYRQRSASLPDINTRLASVLSQKELSSLNSNLYAAAREWEFSPELVSSYEETRNGSLYPLVQRGHIDTLVAYLDAGADPNEVRKGDADTSPLSLAISVGSEEAVAALIEHGADIDFVHADGDSLLHRAASKGTVAIAERLLISGADVTARNQMGLTPRMTAIVAGLSHSGDAHAEIQALVEAAEELN